MANHTHDCEHCGADRRLTSHCCVDALRDEDRWATMKRDLEEKTKKTLERYGLYSWFSKDQVMRLIWQLETMNDPCLASIAKSVEEKRAAQAVKEAECVHQWSEGFAEFDGSCKLCGKLR